MVVSMASARLRFSTSRFNLPLWAPVVASAASTGIVEDAATFASRWVAKEGLLTVVRTGCRFRADLSNWKA